RWCGRDSSQSRPQPRVSVLTSEVEYRPDTESQILLRLVGPVLSEIHARREPHRNTLAHLDIEVAAEQRRERSLVREVAVVSRHIAVRAAKQRAEAGLDALGAEQAYLRSAHEAVLADV